MSNLTKLQNITSARNKAKSLSTAHQKKKKLLSYNNENSAKLEGVKSSVGNLNKINSAKSNKDQEPKMPKYNLIEEKENVENLKDLFQNAIDKYSDKKDIQDSGVGSEKKIVKDDVQDVEKEPNVLKDRSGENLEKNDNLLIDKSVASGEMNSYSEADDNKDVNKNLTDIDGQDKTGTTKVNSEDDVLSDDENNEEQIKAPTSVSELIDGLSGIEDKYANKTDKDYYEDQLVDIPESLNLEKLDEVDIDIDKLREEIVNKNTLETNKEKNELRKDIGEEVEKLEESKQKAVTSTEQEKAEVDAILDAERLITENDVLKRGLARSSIAILRLGNIEDSRANNLIALGNELNNKLETIEDEIQKLNNELDYSLENLDLSLAISVSDELNEKVSELKKQQEKVVEFNNNISKLESEYQLKRQTAVSNRAELEEKLEEKYEGTVKAKRKEEMVELANSYLYSLPRTEAISVLISNSDLAKYLGDAYYDLYYEQMRRS